jgi:hypothetical protein
MKNTFNNIKHTLANMQIDWPSTQPLTHQSKHQA